MSTFKEIGLNNDLLQSLEELGFEKPTPIQEKSIPLLIKSKKDLVALAQTGTGKTAAFSLPIIHQIDAKNKSVQAIVLCPTRELCIQITQDIYKFIKYVEDVSVVPVYGGAPMGRQIEGIRRGAQIVVGTPGRVQDLINRGKLRIDAIRWLVLDEADEMLNMGFKDEIDAILSETPDSRQTLLFSATMPRAIESIAKKYMKNAEQISSGKRNVGAENVEHHYYMVHARDRYQALRRIADMNPAIYGIVFCRTKRETQEVADKLIADHYNAEAIHGDLAQEQRSQVMGRFRNKKVQILVATDVAARGIDVTDLTHIINYNLPDSNETYIHRSGRTGRANKSGICISIIHMREMGKIRDIERKVGKQFEQKKIPLGEDICEVQLLGLVDKVVNVEIDEHQIEKYLPGIYEKLECMDREELIKHFISIEFNRFLELYKNAIDLNAGVSSRERKREQASSFMKFRINLGMKNKFGVKRLFDVINKHPGLKYAEIGRIENRDFETFFEIDEKYSRNVIASFAGFQYQGQKVKVTEEGKGEGRSFSRNNSGARNNSRGSSRNSRRDYDQVGRKDRNRSGGRGGRTRRG